MNTPFPHPNMPTRTLADAPDIGLKAVVNVRTRRYLSVTLNPDSENGGGEAYVAPSLSLNITTGVPNHEQIDVG